MQKRKTNISLFHQRLKQLRKERKLSQKELAATIWEQELKQLIPSKPEEPNYPKELENYNLTLETKRRCIVGYEKGTFPKDIKDFELICKALDCDVGYLFGEHECKTAETQDIVDATGLSEESVIVLLNLSEREKYFLDRLLKFRNDLYMISGAYKDYQRAVTIRNAMKDGMIEDDFGLETIENKEKIEHGLFTLLNRFRIFADESTK